MPAKGTTQQQLDATNDNILVIVGRLLEATKAASDGIKILSDEAKAMSSSLQVAQQVITNNQQILQALDRIVRTGNGEESLVTRLKLLSENFQSHLEDVEDMNSNLEALTKRVAALEKHHVTSGAKMNIIWWIVTGVGWVVTTAIALYGALHGK
mgnify:CR=1 FL=1